MADLTFEQKKAAAAMWKKHGGGFHGPHVETATIPERAFWHFLAEWAEAQRPPVDAVSNVTVG